MSRTALITGANRGIGFAITKLLSSDSSFSHVFATARNPESATALQEVVKQSNGRVHIIKLEVNEASVTLAAQEVENKLNGKGLDILINNIGICQVADALSPKNLRDNFDTNVVSVQLVTDAFIPLVGKSNEKRIVNISSGAGSNQFAPKASFNLLKAKIGFGAYCVSKAALNMLTGFYAEGLASEGFTVIPIHPGFVTTDMNTNTDPEVLKTAISPDESAAALVGVINKLTPSDNGKFFNYDGTNLPW